MKKILFLFSLVLIFQNCRQDSEFGAEPGVITIDPAFESYVQDFIAEGTKRGNPIDFSDSGLIVEFSDGAAEVNGGTGNVIGFCVRGRHHIVIDKTDWTASSEISRNFLLFHELGHCELDRSVGFAIVYCEI